MQKISKSSSKSPAESPVKAGAPKAETPRAVSPVPSPFRGWQVRLGVVAVCVGADQASKILIVAKLEERGVALLPFFSLTPGRNTGVAFGQLSGLGQLPLLAFTGVVSAGFLFFALRAGHANRALRTGLVVISGGAFGNWLDRLARGSVVDFLHFHVGGWSFPLFNLADSLLTLGAACLILHHLAERKRG